MCTATNHWHSQNTESIPPGSRSSRGNSMALHYQLSLQSHPAPWATLLTFQATQTTYLSTVWAKCNPTYDKLSHSCLSESCVFAGCAISRKIPVPFFNRGRTGKLGRTKVSSVNLNSQTMIGHVVYAELITWASADCMVVAPLVSLSSVCSCELSFCCCLQGCSSTSLYHHCTCPLPCSQPHPKHKSADAKDLCTLQRPVGIQVTHKISLLN